MLCTHYGPLQRFSTHFHKSKEIRVLRPIFPDYIISCNYDGKHRGVHHKKRFLPVTQTFWKTPEDVINKFETRSKIQKKKVFFENIKNKYFKYGRTKAIKNPSLLISYSKSDEYTDDEFTDSESSGCFETALIGSSDNDSEQTGSEQIVLQDEIKSSLKNMIKETIADKTESNLLEIENEIGNKNKDNM